MDVTIFMAFQPGELPNVNYQHTIQRYNKIPENSPGSTKRIIAAV